MANYQIEVIKQGTTLTKLSCRAVDASAAIRLAERQLNLSPKRVKLDDDHVVSWTGYEFVARCTNARSF